MSVDYEALWHVIREMIASIPLFGVPMKARIAFDKFIDSKKNQDILISLINGSNEINQQIIHNMLLIREEEHENYKYIIVLLNVIRLLIKEDNQIIDSIPDEPSKFKELVISEIKKRNPELSSAYNSDIYPYDANDSDNSFLIMLQNVIINKNNGDKNNVYLKNQVYTLLNRAFEHHPNPKNSNVVSIRVGEVVKNESVYRNIDVFDDNNINEIINWTVNKQHDIKTNKLKFCFGLTHLKTASRENKHGVLKGNHAVFSLHKSVSHVTIKKIDKRLINSYPILRSCTFLLRNLIRSVSYPEFQLLHEGLPSCLLNNPGNNSNDTYLWIVNELNFELCNECKKVWLKLFEEVSSRSIMIELLNTSIWHACNYLKGFRDGLVEEAIEFK